MGKKKKRQAGEVRKTTPAQAKNPPTKGGRKTRSTSAADSEFELARLAAIVEQSDDAIISKDLDGTILTWNRSAERLYGYAADEAVRKNVSMLYPQDKRAESDEILERVRRGERIAAYETVRVCKDGKRVDVSVTISPIRDSHGRIIGASTIGRDISAIKAAAQRADENSVWPWKAPLRPR